MESHGSGDPGTFGKRRNGGCMSGAIPFAGTLGLELVSAAPERTVGRLGYAPRTSNANGVMHGGSLMAMGDNFGGVCAYMNLPEGVSTATIESKTNFFRPVRDGRVESISYTLHVGRSTIIGGKTG